MESLLEKFSRSLLPIDQLKQELDAVLPKKKKGYHSPSIEDMKRMFSRAVDSASEILFENVCKIIKVNLEKRVEKVLRNSKKDGHLYCASLNSFIVHIQYAVKDMDLPVTEINKLNIHLLSAVTDIESASVRSGEEPVAVSRIFLKLTLVLGHHPENIIDVLLNCKTLLYASARQPLIYVPLIKRVFSSLKNRSPQSPQLYLKYLLIGKLWLFMTKKEEVGKTRTYIISSVKPPRTFLDWAEQNKIPWLKLHKLNSKHILRSMRVSFALRTLYSDYKPPSSQWNACQISKKRMREDITKTHYHTTEQGKALQKKNRKNVVDKTKLKRESEEKVYLLTGKMKENLHKFDTVVNEKHETKKIVKTQGKTVLQDAPSRIKKSKTHDIREREREIKTGGKTKEEINSGQIKKLKKNKSEDDSGKKNINVNEKNIKVDQLEVLDKRWKSKNSKTVESRICKENETDETQVRKRSKSNQIIEKSGTSHGSSGIRNFEKRENLILTKYKDAIRKRIRRNSITFTVTDMNPVVKSLKIECCENIDNDHKANKRLIDSHNMMSHDSFISESDLPISLHVGVSESMDMNNGKGLAVKIFNDKVKQENKEDDIIDLVCELSHDNKALGKIGDERVLMIKSDAKVKGLDRYSNSNDNEIKVKSYSLVEETDAESNSGVTQDLENQEAKQPTEVPGRVMNKSFGIYENKAYEKESDEESELGNTSESSWEDLDSDSNSNNREVKSESYGLDEEASESSDVEIKFINTTGNKDQENETVILHKLQQPTKKLITVKRKSGEPVKILETFNESSISPTVCVENSDSDIEILHVEKANPKGSKMCKNKLTISKDHASDIDEASGSDSDIIPCDEKTKMFTDEETKNYHNKLMEDVMQRKVENILKEEEKELKRKRVEDEKTKNISPNAKSQKTIGNSIDKETVDKKSAGSEDLISQMINNLYKTSACVKSIKMEESFDFESDDDSDIEVVLQTIVKDTGRMTSIHGIRERLLNSSVVKDEPDENGSEEKHHEEKRKETEVHENPVDCNEEFKERSQKETEAPDIKEFNEIEAHEFEGINGDRSVENENEKFEHFSSQLRNKKEEMHVVEQGADDIKLKEIISTEIEVLHNNVNHAEKSPKCEDGGMEIFDNIFDQNDIDNSMFLIKSKSLNETQLEARNELNIELKNTSSDVQIRSVGSQERGTTLDLVSCHSNVKEMDASFLPNNSSSVLEKNDDNKCFSLKQETGDRLESVCNLDLDEKNFLLEVSNREESGIYNVSQSVDKGKEKEIESDISQTVEIKMHPDTKVVKDKVIKEDISLIEGVTSVKGNETVIKPNSSYVNVQSIKDDEAKEIEDHHNNDQQSPTSEKYVQMDTIADVHNFVNGSSSTEVDSSMMRQLIISEDSDEELKLKESETVSSKRSKAKESAVVSRKATESINTVTQNDEDLETNTKLDSITGESEEKSNEGADEDKEASSDEVNKEESICVMESVISVGGNKSVVKPGSLYESEGNQDNDQQSSASERHVHIDSIADVHNFENSSTEVDSPIMERLKISEDSVEEFMSEESEMVSSKRSEVKESTIFSCKVSDSINTVAEYCKDLGTMNTELDYLTEESKEKSSEGGDEDYEASSDASEDLTPRIRRRTRSSRRSFIRTFTKESFDSDASPEQKTLRIRRTSNVTGLIHLGPSKKINERSCLEMANSVSEASGSVQSSWKLLSDSTSDEKSTTCTKMRTSSEFVSQNVLDAGSNVEATSASLLAVDIVNSPHTVPSSTAKPSESGAGVLMENVSADDTSDSVSSLNLQNTPKGSFSHTPARRRSARLFEKTTSQQRRQFNDAFGCSDSVSEVALDGGPAKKVKTRVLTRSVTCTESDSKTVLGHDVQLKTNLSSNNPLSKENNDTSQDKRVIGKSKNQTEFFGEGDTMVINILSSNAPQKAEEEQQELSSNVSKKIQKSQKSGDDHLHKMDVEGMNNSFIGIIKDKDHASATKESEENVSSEVNEQKKDILERETSNQVEKEGEELEVLSTSDMLENEDLCSNFSASASLSDSEEHGSILNEKVDTPLSQKSLRSLSRHRSRMRCGKKEINLDNKRDESHPPIPPLKVHCVSEAVLSKEVLISPEVSDEECELVSPGVDNGVNEAESLPLPKHMETTPKQKPSPIFISRHNLRKKNGGIRSPQKMIPEEQDETTLLRYKVENVSRPSQPPRIKSTNTLSMQEKAKTKPSCTVGLSDKSISRKLSKTSNETNSVITDSYNLKTKSPARNKACSKDIELSSVVSPRKKLTSNGGKILVEKVVHEMPIAKIGLIEERSITRDLENVAEIIDRTAVESVRNTRSSKLKEKLNESPVTSNYHTTNNDSVIKIGSSEKSITFATLNTSIMKESSVNEESGLRPFSGRKSLEKGLNCNSALEETNINEKVPLENANVKSMENKVQLQKREEKVNQYLEIPNECPTSLSVSMGGSSLRKSSSVSSSELSSPLRRSLRLKCGQTSSSKIHDNLTLIESLSKEGEPVQDLPEKCNTYPGSVRIDELSSTSGTQITSASSQLTMKNLPRTMEPTVSLLCKKKGCSSESSSRTDKIPARLSTKEKKSQTSLSLKKDETPSSFSEKLETVTGLSTKNEESSAKEFIRCASSLGKSSPRLCRSSADEDELCSKEKSPRKRDSQKRPSTRQDDGSNRSSCSIESPARSLSSHMTHMSSSFTHDSPYRSSCNENISKGESTIRMNQSPSRPVLNRNSSPVSSPEKIQSPVRSSTITNRSLTRSMCKKDKSGLSISGDIPQRKSFPKQIDLPDSSFCIENESSARVSSSKSNSPASSPSLQSKQSLSLSKYKLQDRSALIILSPVKLSLNDKSTARLSQNMSPVSSTANKKDSSVRSSSCSNPSPVRSSSESSNMLSSGKIDTQTKSSVAKIESPTKSAHCKDESSASLPVLSDFASGNESVDNKGEAALVGIRSLRHRQVIYPVSP